MELFELLRKRRSIRAFEDRDIEQEKLTKILEAANLAPSAGNEQAYRIFVVKDKHKIRRLAKAAFDQSFVAEAPVVLVFCSNPEEAEFYYGKRGRDLYSLQDATIAATFAMLACHDLGLATCWVGAFDEEEVKEILKIKRLRPIGIFPIGYPAEKPIKTKRKSLEELVRFV